MKKKCSFSEMFGLIIIPAFVFFFLIGCGKKTLPVPPVDFDPPKITNLDYSIHGSRLQLTWSLPDTKISDESVSDGFFVYMSKQILSEEDCEGCPVKFKKVAEVRKSPKGVYSYGENIEKGFRYVYKVVPFSDKGVKGTSSNIIKFKFFCCAR